MNLAALQIVFLYLSRHKLRVYFLIGHDGLHVFGAAETLPLVIKPSSVHWQASYVHVLLWKVGLGLLMKPHWLCPMLIFATPFLTFSKKTVSAFSPGGMRAPLFINGG